MASAREIGADFPFEPHFVDVHGSRMHYVDEGSGDPILFLHGNPTSSYLWRNVIPHLTPLGRCIAPDLIGFGKSGKPDIDYRFFDHVRYVDGFIEAMGLDNVTLVIHDWGTALGFHYAMRNEGNVKGMAFMEAMLRPMRWAEFPADFKMGFRVFRTPVAGWLMIAVMNMFVNQILPRATARKLTEEEMRHYREPFTTVASRKPVWRWPNEIPIDGKPADVTEAVSRYNEWLQRTDLPKLLFYAEPGGIIRETDLEWCRQNMKNLKTVSIGQGIHYLQEDNPHLIGQELAEWYKGLG